VTRPDPENDEPSPKHGDTRPTHHLVGLKLMGPLTKEIPMVDFGSIWDAFKLRWWIVPLCMFIGAGLMYSQKSSTPAVPTSVVLVRTYGAQDETSGLAVFGIPPDSIREFPSFQNQLSLIEPVAEVPVSVKLSEPQVSMVATATGEGRQYFTLTSSGIPNYEFVCSASERRICDDAMETYVNKVEIVRADSIKEGLTRLINQISSVVKTDAVPQPVLETQLRALESFRASTTGQLQLVRESIEILGGPARSVGFSTYFFGLVVGFVISVLIILQLTMTDDRIRSIRHLAGMKGGLQCLGEISLGSESTDSKHIVVAIVKALPVSEKDIAFVSVGLNVSASPTLGSLGEAGIGEYLTHSLLDDLDKLSVSDLLACTSPYVLVAHRNISTKQQLIHTHETLARTGNLVLGVILTSLK
jgi:hypothetical protein